MYSPANLRDVRTKNIPSRMPYNNDASNKPLQQQQQQQQHHHHHHHHHITIIIIIIIIISPSPPPPPPPLSVLYQINQTLLHHFLRWCEMQPKRLIQPMCIPILFVILRRSPGWQRRDNVRVVLSMWLPKIMQMLIEILK